MYNNLLLRRTFPTRKAAAPPIPSVSDGENVMPRAPLIITRGNPVMIGPMNQYQYHTKSGGLVNQQRGPRGAIPRSPRNRNHPGERPRKLHHHQPRKSLQRRIPRKMNLCMILQLVQLVTHCSSSISRTSIWQVLSRYVPLHTKCSKGLTINYRETYLT